MRRRIRVAIAGVGNCASALLQGHSFYNNNSHDSTGLTAHNLGGLEPGDIDFVAAFDVVESKVGKDLSEAIYAPPNNTVNIAKVKYLDVKVEKGEVWDGLGTHYREKVKVSGKPAADVRRILRESRAEILLNYLPVGSRDATRFYAESCLDTGVSFINAIPVFIASDTKWQQSFQNKNLACAGDDVMSQLGATVVHKTLVKLFIDRGVKAEETYQLNIGGDMDFYNMLDEIRLEDKRASKTSAVAAMAPYGIPMRIGPSDYVEFLKNDKVCYISIRGKCFGNLPIELDLKLRVVDGYNSAGIMIDAIRGAKLAIDRGIAGPLESLSSYCFKHPPIQMDYQKAKTNFLEFVDGKRAR